MRISLLLPGLLFAALALPALAAPWQTLEVQQGEVQLRYAYQVDDTQQYRLAVSCIIGSGGHGLFVQTPEAWEDTTSYAPQVPLAMSFDGSPRPNLLFAFANGGGFLMVVHERESFAGERDQLLDALKATSRVDVSYFDTLLSFSGEGSRAAIEAIDSACHGA